MQSIDKHQNPTAAVLLAAKVKNIDLTWILIVGSLLEISEYKLTERICREQGWLIKSMQRLKNIDALVPLIGDSQIAVNVSAFCDSLDFLKYLMDSVGLNPSICSEYCQCYQA